MTQLCVVGLGMLGASLCAATRKHFPNWRIKGVSSASTLNKATEAGLIDSRFEYKELNQAVHDCDIVFLCTPIDHIRDTLMHWTIEPPNFNVPCVISDVGSTKGTICSLAKEIFGKQFVGPNSFPGVFIGSHPMAGSEKTGIEARDERLFENAAWILCPDQSTPIESITFIRDYIAALGARILQMHAEQHDILAAYISHLPQVLSTTLACTLSQAKDSSNQKLAEAALQMAGNGFKDMTRLASSSVKVWNPIFDSNRGALLEGIHHFQNALSAFENALKEQNINSLEENFKNAQELRSKLSHNKKGFSHVLTEILVDLEDKPGMLINVLHPLSQKQINILDVEILKVREGEGGTLMLAFSNESDANLAIECLHSHGHQCRLR